MTTARPLPLKFQVGARTLASIRRDLVRVPLSLDEAIAGQVPHLPPLDPAADGYLVTSLPEPQRDALVRAVGGMVAFVRQRYARRYADLTIGFDAYLEQLTANTRSAIKRKGKKAAQASGGQLDVRRYATPEQLADFHGIARRLALGTYQERLMGAGLPDTPDFTQRMFSMATAGHVRAWLLYVGGEPAAYLYCPIHGDTAIYEFVGHNPKFNDLSVGAVLQVEALRDLFADDRVKRFDFTEGDGQHKRQFSTGGVTCCDVLLLRPSIANRAAIAALSTFDGMMALAKNVVERLGLHGMAKKVRRS
ncbi:GNAT family N-acetyltransferase [Sphingomonas bacterium]|uniref:GNAT family N-acetyltransferase n=1 Tax=Sphingomonas bacterium TaxID=1895847 RepID=UPI00260F2692|nr:GNAT family N-acetyltransferase [Sphingomonas bacterium]MDB5679961.1 family N-acetyltransferase [Sphingomonas bacterium]